MKGLLIKDFQLLVVNKTTLPIFLVISIMMLVLGEQNTVSFVIAYFTMLCGILAVGTISYDEADHSIAYLMTSPVTRRCYAIEKYMFSVFAMFIGWVVSVGFIAIFSIIREYEIDWSTWFITSVITVMALVIFIMVLLPIQMKFGATNSRIAMIIMMAVVMVTVFAGKKAGEMMKIDGGKLVEQINGFFENVSAVGMIGAAFAITVIVTLISMALSIRIMKKKEF